MGKEKTDRNCLSNDPEDCLVWCLVEVPAQHKSVVVKRMDVTCSNDFTFIKQENKCIRGISVTSDKPRMKFIDLQNNKEIFPEGLKKVDCQD